MAAVATRPPEPVRPIEALRALRALLASPDDTAQVFRVIRALSGRSFERVLDRVLADPTGRRILEERRSLLPALADRARLRALPDGTLGREYARFMDAEAISAEGLLEASRSPEPEPEHRLGAAGQVLGERLRDMHDLWHVVTGYGRDLFGEAALLAFTYAQTRNRGIGAIVLVGLWRMWRGGAREAAALVRRAWWRGRRAAFLPAADWEALLELPLDEVRRRLRVGPPPTYTPLRSTAAPPVGAPA
jgi:ubiquinone biosynthesis protein COQ4